MRRPSSTLYLLLYILLAGGCTFNRRSTELSCTVGSDCPNDRMCVEGWCIARGPDDARPPDAPIDARVIDADPNEPDAVPMPDAFVCPNPCSRCDLDVCVFSCAASGSCGGLVTCPPGYKCKVECIGADSCGGGIDCSDATRCQVVCGANNACGGLITCGNGPCTVGCGVTAACVMGVDCANACACDVTCNGPGSCTNPPTCPGPAACDLMPGCTSGPDGGVGSCNTCP